MSRWLSRTDADRAFEVAIGAILTQNTAWTNVETALVCLSSAKLMTPKRIASARLSTIQTCIRSSGYFRQKAKKLKLFARFVEKELEGNLNAVMSFRAKPRKLPIGRSLRAGRDDIVDMARRRLLSLWGIGPETADTILLYGLNVPSFVVDTYTRRFLVEVTGSRRWLKMPYGDVQAFCTDVIPRSVKNWQEAHAFIVAWGETVREKLSCRPEGSRSDEGPSS